MVSTPAIIWTTTHLPSSEWWKAELAWSADLWRRVYPQSGHLSTIDRAQGRESTGQRPTSLPLSRAANRNSNNKQDLNATVLTFTQLTEQIWTEVQSFWSEPTHVLNDPIWPDQQNLSPNPTRPTITQICNRPKSAFRLILRQIAEANVYTNKNCAIVITQVFCKYRHFK